ncbi:MAG TPA: hypothetical protein VHN16_17550 [Streptosporangiaceae bacterium]|nr:hypothetical protein [Streptosporangiaceae bacterium]
MVICAARAPVALTERIRRSPHRTLTLTATLTAGGRPLRGQPVSFTTGPTRLCTRDTSTRVCPARRLTVEATIQL